MSFIVHSRREVNAYLKEGQYFFADIRKEGIVLYELDDEPLAEPKPLSPADQLRVASEHYVDRFSLARTFLKGCRFYVPEQELRVAAFELHQSIEQAYSCVLLTPTN
ncbi:putative nucleotidyltransferase protein [Rhizobium favelukesii]|uniref:Nucleotidyltransferase protein n=1 Tax=Rhizobium favelukesii TaxID=348824 RepID=W6RB65_9HYPH|nr:putative nucleotidyltransferase protein [Rhizobium favelukesii]